MPTIPAQRSSLAPGRAAAALATAACSFPALAQPPANDDCSGATFLPLGGSVTGSVAGASGTSGTATPCGVTSSMRDVWHSVYVPCAGDLTLYTCPVDFDSVIVLYPSCFSSVLSCNDNSLYCGAAYPLASALTRSVQPGTYLVRVVRKGGTGVGYTLNALHTPTVPANNQCASARVIEISVWGDGAPMWGCTVAATPDGSADCGDSNSTPDIWYSFTPLCNGTLTAYICPASYDTVLSIHSGCPGTAANQIACNDDSANCGAAYPTTSSVTVPVTRDTPYLIRVSGWNGRTGDFVLNTFVACASGACCYPNGTCEVTTEPLCWAAWSASTDCAAANCPQPGACCSAQGACTLLQAGECTANGGVFHGNGTPCPGTCASPGACCRLDGTCAQADEGSCRSVNGLFGGVGQACASVPCPAIYAYAGSAVPIMDAPGFTVCGAEAFAEITVAESFTIAGADASLYVSHSFQGDLRMWLEHVETGTRVQIVNQPSAGMGNYGANDFGAPTGPGGLFRTIDSASDFYRTPPVVFSIDGVHGHWKPESPLGAFAGENSAGHWRLVAQDCGPQDVGMIMHWVLSLRRGVGCYANCDASTAPPILNVADFTCFLQKFAAADSYANCDASTTPPVLNVADFTCFLQSFAAGCG